MPQTLPLVCLIALALAGCKGSEYQTAPVKGKVTFQGQPVTSGQLFFHPIADKEKHGNNPGKAAFANLDPDGNYQLSTYDAFDGAVIGHHRVSYVPAGSQQRSLQIHADQAEQTVAPGENVFNFELTAAAKR